MFDFTAVLAIIVFAIIGFILFNENKKYNKESERLMRELEIKREVETRVKEELKKKGIDE